MLKEVMTEGFILFLFILLTLSMGIIFQFFLYKLRELNKVQKRIIDSLHFVLHINGSLYWTKQFHRIADFGWLWGLRDHSEIRGLSVGTFIDRVYFGHHA